MRCAAGEAGYALVAAVASIAVFALIALTVIEASRGGIDTLSAEAGHAQAAAAADAGLALALSDILNSGAAGRGGIDGRVRRVRFGTAELAITIEDEKGKVPINQLEPADVRRLMEEAGLRDERLDIATDSLLDWLDDDDDVRPNGAETAYYAERGLYQRNGGLRAIAEVALIRGLDADLARRLERIATVHWGGGPFNAGTAPVEAIRVMEGDLQGAATLIARQRELAGQRTAIALGANQSLARHALTVQVEARLDNGARALTRQLVVLTGRPSAPVYVRERY